MSQPRYKCVCPHQFQYSFRSREEKIRVIIARTHLVNNGKPHITRDVNFSARVGLDISIKNDHALLLHKILSVGVRRALLMMIV